MFRVRCVHSANISPYLDSDCSSVRIVHTYVKLADDYLIWFATDPHGRPTVSFSFSRVRAHSGTDAAVVVAVAAAAPLYSRVSQQRCAKTPDRSESIGDADESNNRRGKTGIV